MAKLGVLVVHGMGNQPEEFANEMIEEIREELADLDKNPNDVFFKPAHWGGILDGRENEIYMRLSQNHSLDWSKLRKNIVIGGFGDAIAYVGPSNQSAYVYKEIHDFIAKKLTELRDELTQKDNSPLLIMGHSLGCVIISNYIWDAQHGIFSEEAQTDFPRGLTLAGMITFGCNLPLFTLAFKPSEVYPISFPGSKAIACFNGRPEVRKHLVWNNYFDPDDVLGYPLKPINSHYAAIVNSDIEIDTGTIMGAHTDYWTDGDFIKPAGRQIAGLLDLL